MTRAQPQSGMTPRSARTLLGWLAALLWLAAVPVLAHAQDDDDELGEDAPTAAGSSSNDQDEAAADDAPHAGGDESAASSPTAASESGPAVIVQPFAGVGWTSRGFERPVRSGGAQALATSFVPALEAGLNVQAWPQESFSLGFALHYQTSLGLTILETPPFALANEVHVRSERLELSVVPSWRLGDDNAPRLAIAVGAMSRTFWPNVHRLMTPGYSLIGPHVRVELVAKLSSSLTLRLGPEVHWIILIDESIRLDGVQNQGLAFGGEALVQLALGPTWSLGLHYRESHAFASTMGSVTFTDVERYMTARLMGAF